MTTSIVLFVFCVVMVGVMGVLHKLTVRWQKEFPHFVWNYVGGVLAVCSITDYKRRKKEGRQFLLHVGKKEPMIIVPETLVFCDPLEDYLPKRFSGIVEWHGSEPRPHQGDFHQSEKALDLFVPFTSEKHMSFGQQEGLFGKPEDDLYAFSAKKRAENQRRDIRLWLAKRRYTFENSQLIFGAFGMLMFMVLCFAWLVHKDKAEAAKMMITHLNASDGAVREVKMLGSDFDQLLVHEDVVYDHYINKGVVKMTEYVGGGISRVCIGKPGNEDIVCGFADSSLHLTESDEAYIRQADLLAWKHTKHDYWHASGSWCISKADAENLLATGKFELLERK